MNYYWATEGLGNNTKILDGYISSPKLTRDGKKLNFYDIRTYAVESDFIRETTAITLDKKETNQNEGEAIKREVADR